MRNVTIRQALQQVAHYPQPISDEWIQTPSHELVCRALFTISNSPDPKVRGSMGRANKARKMILERMVGKRRAGTAPLNQQGQSIEFKDLTGGEIGGSDQPTEETE